MKKISLLASAVLLAMGMCMSVSAEEGGAAAVSAGNTNILGSSTDGTNITWEANQNPSTIDIKGTVVRNDKYSINLNWGNMEFTYNAGTWNTDTHQWDNGGWNEDEFDKVNNKLSLVNHSSQPVFAELQTLVSHSNMTGNIADPVTMTLFRDQTYNSGAAAGSKAEFTNSITEGKNTTYDKDEADKIYITGGEAAAGSNITRDLFLQITGTPSSKVRFTNQTIGSITVTVTSAAEVPAP